MRWRWRWPDFGARTDDLRSCGLDVGIGVWEKRGEEKVGKYGVDKVRSKLQDGLVSYSIS